MAAADGASQLPDRRVLGGPGALVAVGVAFGVALYTLRPDPPAKAEGDLDAVALAYLRIDAVSHPGQMEPALRLSRAQLAVGALDEAEESVAPYRSAPAARVMGLRIDAARWRARPLSDPGRGAARDALADRLDAFSSIALAGGDLRDLAELALELERPALSARFERMRARMSPAQAAAAWAAAGSASLAGGEPGLAADDLARAAALEVDPASARRLAQQALEATVAAGRAPAGGERIAEIAARFADPRLWSLATDAARAIDDLPRARDVLLRWTGARPRDAEPHRRLVEVELAAGDAGAAVAAALRLLELQRNASNRRQLARAAEWSGQPALALREWATLGREDTAAADRAIELAQDLWDVETLANLLAGRAHLLGWAETEKLADAFEHLGRPERAEEFVATYAARHPSDRAARMRLAALQQRQGELPRALATARTAEEEQGADAALASTEAELLWRLHRPEEALAALRRAPAPPADVRFWSLFADLAWKSDRPADALTALSKLWTLAPDASVGRRLARLAFEASDHELTAQVGTAAWRRYRDDDSLSLAIEAELSLGRREEVRALLAEASEDPELSTDERFALLRARAAMSAGNPRQALAEAERAISASPRLRAARLAWLDAALSLADRQDLPSRLAAWREEALGDPLYHRSFARAFEMLGDDEAALGWHARAVASAQGDPFALIGYAAALRRARREADAARAEERALAELDAAPVAGGTDRALAAVWLRERLRGAASARPAVEALLSEAAGDPRVQSFAVGWSLRRGDRRAAAAWLEAMRGSGAPPGRARLDLAIASGDRDEIAAAAEESEIGPRAWAVAQLGQERRALRLSEEALRGSVQDADEVKPLVARLRRRLSPALRAEASASRVGELSTRGVAASLYAGTALDQDVEARLETRQLRGPSLVSPLAEIEARAGTAFEIGEWRLSTAGGASGRENVWVPAATAGAQLRSGAWAGAGAELSTGQPAEESAELRRGAWKTRAVAGLRYSFASSNEAGLVGSAAAWRAPSGEQLGRGLFLDGQLAHRLSDGAFQPWLRVTANASRTQRAGTPAAAALTAFLPPRGLASGVGLVLRRGDLRHPDVGAGIEAELWTGWLFHERRAGYLARLEMSLPVGSGLDLGAGFSLADGGPGPGSTGRQSIYLRIVQRLKQ